MSELTVGQLRGLPVNNNVVTVPSGHTLYAPGHVVQVKTVRSDSRSTFSMNNSGNGVALSPLNLEITPKFSNSLLLITWMVNAESNNDGVFVLHKNGSLITTSGETGYNAEAGNNRWSGVASMSYDENDSSTPSNYYLQYFCLANSTSSQTFAPAVRSSSATNQVFYLNRPKDAIGESSYENMISTGTVMEIAQ
jgi:hypothetical protein